MALPWTSRVTTSYDIVPPKNIGQYLALAYRGCHDFAMLRLNFLKQVSCV